MILSPMSQLFYCGRSICTSQIAFKTVVRNFTLKSTPRTCQLDPIPTPLIMECLDTLLPSLAALINSSLSSAASPQVLKTSSKNKNTLLTGTN